MRDPAILKDEDYIIVDPKNPIPNPQLGPLERTVGLPYEEALFLDEVDAEAQEYWFTEPADGWRTEKRRLRKLQQLEHPEPEAFGHTDSEAAGRTRLAELREGAVLRGTVVAQLLYYGAQVDIGAEFDGLLVCQDEQWRDAEVAAELAIGQEVEVRVYRVRDPSLFRFPVQLAAVNSQVASIITPPEEHEPPMDLRYLTMTPEEIAARSEGQREWVPKTWLFYDEAQYDYEWGLDLRYEPEESITLLPQQQAAMDAHVDRIVDSMF